MRSKKIRFRLAAGILCLAMLLQQAAFPVRAKTVPGLEDEITEEEMKEAEARA